MIDPLVGRAIATAFALLWLLAAWHKVSAGERFVATLPRVDHTRIRRYRSSGRA